jgi:xanthine dehydrogenase iron-sulfur cluster and FAD-binding subunit A
MSTATSHYWLVATLVTDPVCVCFGFQSVRSAAGEIIRGRTLEEDKTPEREKRPTRAAYLHARRPREALALAMSEQVV